SVGTWYLMHDDTVNRTTIGAGALGSLADAAINALIINGGLGYDTVRHRTALKVPTLASVLEAMERFGVLVWLDNKVAADADDLVEFLIATGCHRKALLLLHSQDAVSAVRGIDPAIPVARLDNHLNP